ncbi:hypothetical protein VPH35_043231 [Triticum aestivum]
MVRPRHELAYARGTPQLELLRAATTGDLAHLERMVRKLDGGRGRLAEQKAVNDHGAGALHPAASSQNLEVCEYLVEDVGVNVDAVDEAGRTPVVWAIIVKGGQVDIVRYLLDHGANPDNADRTGITPLHEAVERGNLPLPPLSHRSLLSRGAYVDPFSTIDGTPLHVAAEHNAARLGLTGALKCPLDAGADPNDQDEQSQWPIQLAAYFGTCKDVEILFGVTSRIPAVHDWSVDGIISYAKAQPKLEDLPLSKMTVAELKKERSKAMFKEDYNAALEIYNMICYCTIRAPEIHFSFPAIGFCRLILHRDGALNDAQICRQIQPECPHACWLEGYSYLLLQEFEKACDSFIDAVKLDPRHVGIKKALREALRLLTESDADMKKVLEGPEYRPIYLYH